MGIKTFSGVTAPAKLGHDAAMLSLSDRRSSRRAGAERDKLTSSVPSGYVSVYCCVSFPHVRLTADSQPVRISLARAKEPSISCRLEKQTGQYLDLRVYFGILAQGQGEEEGVPHKIDRCVYVCLAYNRYVR